MAREWIPWAKPALYGDEADAVVDALRSTWISGGPYVDAFEKEMALRLGSPYAIAVSNGTTALHLALLGLGIGPGDEVVVPAFTFVAAANMALAAGANLVFADVDPFTWLIEPVSVARVISPRTRAIVAVHLYGNVADMDALAEIASEHRTALVEDAAEACFSRYKGRSAGTMGHVGTLSFQATKTITTGEGGMVLTPDERMFRRMVLLRDHGMRQDKRYWHDVVGYNYRLTNLQAALGCAQLRHLETIRTERARVHQTYRDCLADTDNFQQQVFREGVDALLWTFAGRIEGAECDTDKLEARRDAVIGIMKERGIETRPGFYALSTLPPYGCPELPNASRVAASVISLPTYPSLADQTIERICDELRRALDLVLRPA
jgi:perosamine synthetase